MTNEPPVNGRLFKLRNTVKQYDWGSVERIPGLLGLDNPKKLPWAELWMGIHPEGPSEALWGDNSRSLARLIGENPRRYLGAEAADRFGTLPFLFKLLAAAKPLSIQAHPNREQAERGWERENARAIPPDAPGRNYRDRNHKPEILAAVDPFTALCGFREPGEILARLTLFLLGGTASRGQTGGLLGSLEGPGSPEEKLRSFFSALFALPPAARKSLGDRALQGRERLTGEHPQYRGEWELAASLAAAYPGDPGIIAPLYLNLINLEPGEAIFLPAGVLHAYVRGFGVELMANSDNVLRGGLTAKHVDLEELVTILNFTPFRPEILRAPRPAPPCFKFPSACGEFSLSLITGRGEETVFPDPGPAILILVAGEAEVIAGGETVRLKGGESVFIAGEGGGDVRLRGDFTLYAAGVGTEGNSP